MAVGTESVLQGYLLKDILHEGDEAVVYRASSTAEKKPPVIAKMTRHEYPTSRHLGRLRREYAILRDLEGLHTPKPIGLEEREHGLVLVMSDIGHGNLSELMSKRRLGIEESLRIAISLLDVLASVHSRKVIHKDVTPRNILVDERTLDVYLIDFGISARLSQEVQKMGAATALEGTLLYIAPEQTGRMNRSVDTRADLYSAGAVLYQMLTGVPPFVGDEPGDLIYGHLAQRPISPHERDSLIPEPLSDIVMKLLEKVPEERYQSDAGVKHDLAECLRQYRAKKSISPFPLRRRDKAPELRRAQKLYGREADIELLVQAFERTRLRGPELVLVTGYAGIGKSALVNETQKLISRVGGFLVSGKFDQISRDVPLAPIASALRELILQILTESQDELNAWKKDLEEALGGHGQVLIELVPELELVIGPQPPLAPLSPDQAKNRFQLALQNFLHVFAAAEHPLVIFLDDLQWVDHASLSLLTLLLTDSYSEHLMIIGAYRDNEIAIGHPLSHTLDELKKSGFSYSAIHLEPLTWPMIRLLVADTLTSTPEETEPLAQVVYEKTLGNPFFAHQFMIALYERDLLGFDAEDGIWRWNVANIRAENVTDNVVELMVEKLRRLPAETQQMLKLASCIGHQFDIQAMSTIAEKSIPATASALWGAIREGLIVPMDSEYRLLEDADMGGAVSMRIPIDFDVHYKFLHDRILQATYTLVESDMRPVYHLSIGRLLRRRAGSEPRGEDLMEIVRHLNLGVALMADSAERIDLARLNLRAARKAKASVAYHAAAEHLRHGQDLLGDNHWEDQYDLCFALYTEAGECEFVAGDAERSQAAFSKVLPRAKTDLERAQIHCIRIFTLSSQARYTESLAAAAEGLALLGHPLSMQDIFSPAVMEAELHAVGPALRGRKISDIIHEPEVQDPAIRCVMAIFDALAVPGYFSGPIAQSVIGLRGANIALRYGNSEYVAMCYATMAYILALILNDVQLGCAFSDLSVALYKKYPANAAIPTRVCVIHGCVMPMQAPLRESEKVFLEGRQYGLSSGDYLMLGANCLLLTATQLLVGNPLQDTMDNADKNMAIIRRTRDLVLGLGTMTVMRQAVACLLGRTESYSSFVDDSFNEQAWLERYAEGDHFGHPRYHHAFLKLMIHYLYGDYDKAEQWGQVADAHQMFAGGNPPGKALPFYRCLTIYALPATEDQAELQRRAGLVESYRKQLDMYAGFSPKTFGHQKALVDAEAARHAGDIKKAINEYENAIQLSAEYRAPHIEAMANELCSKFYLSIGALKAAGTHMRSAYRAYVYWGAMPKAEALEKEHEALWPSLSEAVMPRARSSSTSSSSSKDTPPMTNTSGTLLTRTSVGSLRDASLVIRAAQAIAGEIELPKVIDRLMSIVLENAGAQRGTLILSREGKLYIEASLGLANKASDISKGALVDDVPNIAKGIVFYVARTQDSVVLDDAALSSRFADDPYVKGSAPKSILCLPLLYQARLIGLLYLENTTMAGVFNAARVELLALLSSQAAIAIENARLIATVRIANAEIQRINERLEADVARRTEELRHANEDLFEANTLLEQELKRREEAEAQRATLQEQVITAQRARLAEMSTPLIPITDEIVVMPLVGTIDRERAQQVLSVALEGAQRNRAQFVIIDITGIKQIDTHVAGTLVGVGGALRLLGTETVLTGIAPTIAQTLVNLGIDLSSFVTMGTLQSGMEYALSRGRRLSAMGYDTGKRRTRL